MIPFDCLHQIHAWTQQAETIRRLRLLKMARILRIITGFNHYWIEGIRPGDVELQLMGDMNDIRNIGRVLRYETEGDMFHISQMRADVRQIIRIQQRLQNMGCRNG